MTMLVRIAVASLLLACVVPAHAATVRLGDGTGLDWEPAVAVDGSHVYAFWPHYAATALQDSSGATCMPFKGTGRKTTSSYMYFQASNDGGATWGPVSIPRCPVTGNNVDAQLAVGANHRLYAAYMDGNASYTPIMVIYSDDFGATWSTPIDATNGGRGDKDLLLVDAGNNVMVAFENGGKQFVSTSTSAGASFVKRQVNIAPSGVALATGGALDTDGNAYYVWAGTTNNGTGPTTFYLQRSNNLFSSYSVTTIDKGAGGPQVTGAGWDFWGGSMQLAIQPRSGPNNDRVVVVYNAGPGASGVAERIYTKYSDTLGASFNIPFNASSWPNGTQLSTAATGAWHAFPAIAATGNSVKVFWMDNRATPGGNYTCASSSQPAMCGVWNVYSRSSPDGTGNWSAETTFGRPTPYRPYQSAAGFNHPYGDYGWMVTDAQGNYYAVWGEGESKWGTGDVYFLKF